MTNDLKGFYVVGFVSSQEEIDTIKSISKFVRVGNKFRNLAYNDKVE